jgi:glycerol uptake facilitator-like aquaporin
MGREIQYLVCGMLGACIGQVPLNGMWGYGLDRAGSGQGQVAGTCDSSNEVRRVVNLRVP